MVRPFEEAQRRVKALASVYAASRQAERAAAVNQEPEPAPPPLQVEEIDLPAFLEGEDLAPAMPKRKNLNRQL